MIKQINSFLFLVAFLIAICFPGLVLANSYSALHYKITPDFTGEVPIIKIEAKLIGKFSREVVVDFPGEWASVEKYFDQIKNIHLNNSKGTLEFNSHKPYQATIELPEATSSITIEYEVQQKSGDPALVEETIVRKNLVHTTGYGIFVVPHVLQATDQKVEFSVVWEGLPERWKTMSSYSTARSFKLKDNVPYLLHSLYVAGDIRTYKLADANAPIYLSLYGNFDLKDRVFVHKLAEIIKTQRTFFNDYDFPYYAVSLIEGDDPTSAGGTGLRNSFAMFLPRGEAGERYYLLFAHEHFHNWTGFRIHSNKATNYWWSEGFTDYYSRVLALRSYGISIGEFITECNRFLRQYYLSSLLNESNSRIAHDFWQIRDVQMVPYYRGFVFAIYLNYLIKKSNSKYSLDDVMRDLLREAKHQSFSCELFKKVVKKYIPQGITKELTMFIDEGKAINLDGVFAFLPLEKIAMGNYELGFDRDMFVREKVIEGLDSNSNAYKSGLRNGDEAVGWDISAGGERGDPNQVVTIHTTTKTFKFRPESPNKKMVYQFKYPLSIKGKEMVKQFFGG